MSCAARALAGRPTVTLRLTRDSVAAGDDIDAPHERVVEIPPLVDPVVLVRHLAPGYLASVGGAGHSWLCRLNGRLVATVMGNGREVRAEVRDVTFAATNDIHFTYLSATW